MKPKSKFISKIAAGLVLLTLSNGSQAGSLWREGVTDERGMFSDKRAKRVGDILTVVVQETASLSNSVRTKTDKASTNDSGIATNLVNQFLGNLSTELANKTTGIGKQLNGVLPTKNTVLPVVPTLTTTGTNDYTGGGEIKNSQTIATRCAVQIIDTLPNGNLIVEGVRQISFSKERQFASLRGIVRAYDILADNTVLSSNIADARIDIVSEGTLTETQRKGWLLRLNDKISPF